MEEQKVKLNYPCVLKFGAEWCRPCQKIKPEIQKWATLNKGKLTFYDVDTDKAPEIVEKYNITSIPVFVFLNSDSDMNKDKLKPSEISEKLVKMGYKISE